MCGTAAAWRLKRNESMHLFDVSMTRQHTSYNIACAFGNDESGVKMMMGITILMKTTKTLLQYKLL
jgi:hypothetical protein